MEIPDLVINSFSYTEKVGVVDEEFLSHKKYFLSLSCAMVKKHLVAKVFGGMLFWCGCPTLLKANKSTPDF